MSELSHIMNRSYDSATGVGSIKSTTTKDQFIDNLYDGVFDVGIATGKDDHKAMSEEIADLILDALNFAKHFEIDIESKINERIKTNYEIASKLR